MVKRNGKSTGNGRKNAKSGGLMGAVKRHPVRAAGIAAGAVVGLTLLGKAVIGGDHDARGDKDKDQNGRGTGAARGVRKTAGRRTGARGARTAGRGGRSTTRASGRAQSRAESTRTGAAPTAE